jgi:hypothetical protein
MSQLIPVTSHVTRNTVVNIFLPTVSFHSMRGSTTSAFRNAQPFGPANLTMLVVWMPRSTATIGTAQKRTQFLFIEESRPLLTIPDVSVGFRMITRWVLILNVEKLLDIPPNHIDGRVGAMVKYPPLDNLNVSMLAPLLSRL